jgi:hypothetical protein
VDQQHPAKVGPGKTAERRRVQTVTGEDLGEVDLMKHCAVVCSSQLSQVKETFLVCVQVVLAVLEKDQKGKHDQSGVEGRHKEFII